MPPFSKIQIAELWARLDALLKRFGWLGVTLFAVIYYGRYYRSGLNLGGEGGTVAVIAMRLMAGQRPLEDTFLGYNVMWFWPVAWLFQITGPNYIALRLFFFAICTITGILAFFIVRRVTGRGWYAILAALLPVIIPGMLFRNYMAFLVMLNMLTLLQAYVLEQTTERRRILWMSAAGFSIGLTYLVRVDLGGFFTIILLGLVVLYPFGSRAFRPRLKMAGFGLALSAGMFVLTHAPFYLDARQRGYNQDFVSQYSQWFGLVRHLANQEWENRFAKPKPGPEPIAATSKTKTPKDEKTAEPEAKEADIDSSGYLQKRSVGDIWKESSFYDRAFILITYLPIPVALVLVLPAGALLLLALARSNFPVRTDALTVLITSGSALTLFPQYFFFRPDTPHLSEFMAPFLIAMACGVWIAFRLARNTAGHIAAGIITLLCVINTGLYFYHSYPKESAGTIAARWKRKTELAAQNGVRVLLKKKEAEELQTLCDLIQNNTKPGDYLVTYPYAPTVNFMTDRPSYEFNLYVDNAHNVSGFLKETRAEIEKYHPAAILIDNRAVNQTEASRFRNWAASTYQWIQKNYAYAGTFRRQEVYLRPDLYPMGTVPPPTSN